MSDHVEPAGDGDVEVLAELAAAFRDERARVTPSDANLRISIANLLRDGATDFLIAREPGWIAVGYAQLRYRYSAWESGLVAELEDLFVRETARRRGVGRALAAAAVARAAERGCRAIAVAAQEHDEAAVALLSELGFRAEPDDSKPGRELRLTRMLA